jgi:hypothetical protein|tara:strand:- start:5322 stop:7610 length:2289 start_codon:yes stop_codon:yes gene_type:complete
MARNGSGTYSNPYPNFISGTVISSSEVDANNSDIATALTQSIAVDGQSVVTGDIPLATHKFTAMKVGTAATDSLSLGQAQAEAFVWCGTAGGSADAITLSPSPAITAYAAGQRFVWMASGSTNTGATTVAISGLSTIALQDNGAALTAGQHAAGKMFMGILNTTSTVQIMQVQVSGTDPLIVSSLTVTGDATIGDDLLLDSDSAVISLGDNQDVKITHVHDSGLTFKNTSTADDTPFVLLLQTGETDIALNDALGKIQFQAPDEAAGTDAILVAAEIAAVSEGDFSSSNNATKLSFKTAASEAAAEKMTLSSAGNLVVSGDVQTNDDLILNSDSAIAYFGADQDVLLTHVADTGLTMSVTGNNVAQFTVSQDKDDASTGPVLNLDRYSASPADSDGGGIIQFRMENDNDQLFTAAQIYSVATDVTDGTEDGKLIINTMKAGTSTAALTISELGTMTTGGNIVIPDDGYIGSATTPTGSINIRSDGNVGIGASASDTIGLYVYNNTTGDKVGQFSQNHASNNTNALQVSQAGTGAGLYSQVELGTNAAVYGFHNSSSSVGIGTRGYSVSGYGVYGQTGAAAYAGVIGYSQNASQYAILGYNNTYGVYATTVACAGAMSKGSGTFLIPHPLKSEIEGEPWSLAHSFIEGPQCDLIYRGRVNLVNGRATVSMDTKYGMTAGTFAWLTKDVQTFTSNETGWDAVRSSFSGDTLTIECQNADSTDTISWMVVAERNDPNIKESPITDDDGNLIIERPSEPAPPAPED